MHERLMENTKEDGIYTRFIRPSFFEMDPEVAHEKALSLLKVAGKLPPVFRSLISRMFSVDGEGLKVNLWGEIDFKNPVGLAPGFCKDADPDVIKGLSCLGLGFIEVGSVTQFPREGTKERPRLFRLEKERAMINRMGLNNPGVDVVVENLKHLPRGGRPLPIGVNVTGSFGEEDYLGLGDPLEVLRRVYPFADFLVANISCPNLDGLRTRQEEGFERFAGRVAELRQKMDDFPPVLIKISPDLGDGLERILKVALDYQFDGVVATNTTEARDMLDPVTLFRDEKGGLSGRPLKEKSTGVIAEIRNMYKEVPIIGVGGIETFEDARDKMRAGANLVQVYTGLIYKGLGIAKGINKGLLKMQPR